jgi:hypothetical protein
MNFREMALARLGMMGGPGQKPGDGSLGGVYDSVKLPFRPPDPSAMDTGAYGEGRNPMAQRNAPANPFDPRSLMGLFSRGSNVYPGGLPNAQAGSNVNMGRPAGNDVKSAALRRMGGNS